MNISATGNYTLFGRDLNLELSNQMATAYIAIITMALIPIYIGSFLTLSNKKSLSTMENVDIWKFPLIGSATLLSLYVAFKYFNPEYINLLFNFYFALIGVSAIVSTFHQFFSILFKDLKYKTFKIPFLMSEPISYTWLDIPSLIIAIAINVWYLYTKHWISNNIIGLIFAIQGISLISLKNFKIAASILSGLFFYDIFWVFGTDVMVSVAKSFDAPIKLVFPKDLLASELSFTMLGLGDIVIPGFFISLLLRYDHHRAKYKSPFKKTYFTVTFIFYTLGLIFTMVIMHTLRAAQPALLYLVPACIFSSLSTAFYLKDLRKLLNYEEEGNDVKEKES